MPEMRHLIDLFRDPEPEPLMEAHPRYLPPHHGMLYYATVEGRVASIMKHGLDMSPNKRVFLVTDPDVAEQELADALAPSEKIIVLQIDGSKIDHAKLQPHVTGDETGVTYVYHGLIPSAALSVIQ